MPPRVVAFDAYGTLLDVHSAVSRHAHRLGDRARAVSALWRARQLEYSWVRSLAGDYRDFWSLTEHALDHALAAHGVDQPSLRADLLRAYRELDAYPDAAPTLDRLRVAGTACAILSNGEPGMLDDAVRAARLRLDAVLSVHGTGCFKPDARAYAAVPDRFGCEAGQVAFVSSNPWDAFGAGRFGFRVFWLNRAGDPPEYGLERTATVLSGLDALPAALGFG